jgi:hypothetical protein
VNPVTDFWLRALRTPRREVWYVLAALVVAAHLWMALPRSHREAKSDPESLYPRAVVIGGRR